MNISHYLSESGLPSGGSCVALGLFDGLHLGHMAVIERMLALSATKRLTPLMFTFTAAGDGPATKGNMTGLLSFDMMCSLLERHGVEQVVCPNFEQFRHLCPEDFVRKVLGKRLGAAHVVCGEDFRFGKDAAGDMDTLRRLCSGANITAEAVPTVTIDSCPVASRNIRQLVESGDMPTANRLLGRPFTIDFEVIHGRRLGRTLGMPTINQAFPTRFTLPRFGVYLTRVLLNGNLYSGITNVGVKPTTGDSNPPLAETFIQGFEGDLYGQRVNVEFLRFLRDEQKFGSVNELKSAIIADIAHARAIVDGE
ncbi:MAG: riboflavin biosynthesis protein RibF [Oscillospiraceae bacterium]|nr:riboflavin biosynthesis protein RibF [Oscillospiraceae bacterium]